MPIASTLLALLLAASPQGTVPPAPASAPPPAPLQRFGRFDLGLSLGALARLPELRACGAALQAAVGHAECPLGPGDPDHLAALQLAWTDLRPAGEVIALRLIYDAQQAPLLTDVEAQLGRSWGPAGLEQLRRERDQKFFTLQWENGEYRATLEAAGLQTQPSRVLHLVLERKPQPLTGEFAGLHPRPFPGMRFHSVRRLEWEGQPHALVWGTSLTPAQEALGEASPAWDRQRSYIGLWRLEGGSARSRRWRPLWERATAEDEDDPQVVRRVETRDVTGDGVADLEVELSCGTCGPTASEVLVKTVRAGRVVDLLAKHDLFHARVELQVGRLRIHEPDAEDGPAGTVNTYAYDRGRGVFLLVREEREPAQAGE